MEKKMKKEEVTAAKAKNEKKMNEKCEFEFFFSFILFFPINSSAMFYNIFYIRNTWKINIP